MSASLVLRLSVVDPSTAASTAWSPRSPSPSWRAAVFQLWLAWRDQKSSRALFGCLCLAAGLTISLGSTDSVIYEGLIGFHLVLAALLSIGALFDDALGRRVRGAGAVLLTVACVASAAPGDQWLGELAGVRPEMARVYLMLLVVIATVRAATSEDVPISSQRPWAWPAG